MPELCIFCWKSILSKASRGGSQDIIQNIPIELKKNN